MKDQGGVRNCDYKYEDATDEVTMTKWKDLLSGRVTDQIATSARKSSAGRTRQASRKKSGE